MDNLLYTANVGVRFARREPKGRGGDITVAPLPGGAVPLDSAPLPLSFKYVAIDVQAAATQPNGLHPIDYTVPLKRRAVLQTGALQITRHTQPVGSGIYRMSFFLIRNNLQPSPPSAFNNVWVQITMFTEFVGGGHEESQQGAINSGPLELYEGDRMVLEVIDTSNGGSLDYTAGLIGVEFDARDKHIPLQVLAPASAGGSAARQTKDAYYASIGAVYDSAQQGWFLNGQRLTRG